MQAPGCVLVNTAPGFPWQAPAPCPTHPLSPSFLWRSAVRHPSCLLADYWTRPPPTHPHSYTHLCAPPPPPLRQAEAKFNSADLNVAYKMSVDEYQKLCPYAEALEENWGKPPGNLNSNGQVGGPGLATRRAAPGHAAPAASVLLFASADGQPSRWLPPGPAAAAPPLARRVAHPMSPCP